MSLITTTGITLILSTLIYHGGLALLYARAHFGEVLNLSRGERLFTIARYPKQYLWGCRIVLVGWIVAALASVMLAAILRDAGDQIVSTLASVLFLIGIVSAIGYWALHLPITILAAEEAARTAVVPEYYERHQLAAESLMEAYILLGLLATAGFGWALLQTGILPSWVGWVTLGWGLLFTAISLKTTAARPVRADLNGVPLLPMVMQLVIGISLLVK
jgi:hypothetical protein